MKNLSLIFFLVIFNIFVAHAQEIAAELKSKNSIRAPVNIKVDGKMDEWHDKFQAYSNHTQFYYTMSNDDRYLYLTVQAKYPEIINRILKGGITLTINRSGNKTDPNGIHITYPVIDLKVFRVRFSDAPNGKHGGANVMARLDTFVNETNAKIGSRTKFIKVAGVKGVDSLISIYNLDGIKVAAELDNKLRFNYELAVSLIDLGFDIKNPQKFSYQVMINEVDPIDLSTKNPKPGEIYVALTLPGQEATDFWGEYILAK